MSKTKGNRKTSLLISFIIIIAIVIACVVIFGIKDYREKHELQLSNTNETLNNLVTDAGIVDKDEGSFYITLYVTAGVIVIAGVAVFIYIYKKADE